MTFFLPLTLFIWRETRGATIFLIIAALLNLSGILLLNSLTGYTRLLGLPHVLFWTPAAFHIFIVLRRGVPRIPSMIIAVILVTILISLAFDYTDVIRYLAGERGSLIPV